MTRPFKSFVFYPKKRSIHVADTYEAHALVTARYPSAMRHGSVGSWHWSIPARFPTEQPVIVAEAIAANRGTDWFLRMA